MARGAEDRLLYGRVGQNSVHLCVDMQRMFAEATAWQTPWMGRVLPTVAELVRHQPERTIFTRFIPAERPGQGVGTWKRYYEHWASMTLQNLGPEMVQLVPELALFTPPAEVVDKPVYSPWIGTGLHQRLQRADIDTVVITGAETDVCVLATALGAIDYGYRTILVSDALCSSTNETHDASLELYRSRFGQQIETATCGQIIENWM